MNLMDFESLIEAAGFVPDQIVFPDSWCGHLPFASWLMKQLRPACFVELGTHSGTSYLTFCQAAAAVGGETKCFAVDTWLGDEHAGHYGAEVLDKLRSYHDPRYGSFSTLIRSTFDEALDRIEDHSVGLLHIDGLHTFEAVAHDFETWLPKLAPAGVVLLHDTQVREKDFGVWNLWQQLCERHPLNLDFKHSHGLGVLQPGTAGSAGLAWLRPGTMEQKVIYDYFTALGLAMQERYRAVAKDAQCTSLRDELTRSNEAAGQQRAESAATISTLEQRVADLTAAEQRMRAERDAALAQIQEFLKSKSWKLTAPLRFIDQLVKHG